MIVDKIGEVQRYSEKYLLQSSKDNMLRNSISVDMKVYDVQLKQKSTEIIQLLKEGSLHFKIWHTCS